jgi:hypothetical protein
VNHITRAALSLTEEAATQLKIDQKQAKRLFTIAQRLSTVVKTIDKWGNERCAAHLSTVDMDEDIQPWRKGGTYNFIYTEQETVQVDEAKKSGKNGLFNMSLTRLTLAGYQTMLSDFLEYAIPIVEEMGRKLATLVSPETYTELLRLYYGEKP